MSWVIKGYIIEARRWDVNWARVVMSITKEKTRRVQVEKIKNNNKSKVSKLSGGEMSCKIENNVICKDFVVKVGLQVRHLVHMGSHRYHHGA
jgi:hypothetical protein